jgi:hypothetical protein
VDEPVTGAIFVSNGCHTAESAVAAAAGVAAE